MVTILLGPPEILQKPVLKKPSTTLGELEKLRFSRGVNTPSSEPQAWGLQSFYTQTVMISEFARGWAIAKSKTRVSEI